MKSSYIRRFATFVVLSAVAAVGTSVLASAPGRSDQQDRKEERRQRDKEQPTKSAVPARQNNDQAQQQQKQAEDQRRGNERQAQEQQRSEQRRQLDQQKSQDQQKQAEDQRRGNERQAQEQQRSEQRRQLDQQKSQDQQKQAQEQQRQAELQKQEQQRLAEEQKRQMDLQRQGQIRADTRPEVETLRQRSEERKGREADEKGRREAAEREKQERTERRDFRLPPKEETGTIDQPGARKGGAGFRNPPLDAIGRDQWRRREQDMLHLRQNEFRRREEERRRAWEQRQRWLQQQRRMNQWRYHQRYWERLRRDKIRLQSFIYRDFGNPNYSYYRGGQYYYLNQYGADLLRRAVNNGYEEGFRAGSADREDGWRFDYDNSDAYADSTYGYDGYYVNLSEYQYYFREGFRRGYEDGYYGRNQYGSYSNGSHSILGEVLNLVLSLTRF